MKVVASMLEGLLGIVLHWLLSVVTVVFLSLFERGKYCPTALFSSRSPYTSLTCRYSRDCTRSSWRFPVLDITFSRPKRFLW